MEALVVLIVRMVFGLTMASLVALAVLVVVVRQRAAKRRAQAMLPWLTVERQGVFDQDDVQTESDAFNRAYHVQGHADRYAMAVVEPHRFVQRLSLLATIAGLIPSYVWKDYGR